GDTLAGVPRHTPASPRTRGETGASGGRAAGRAETGEPTRPAQLDGFLERLPAGLETVVGESGATLSAGEQLRVTIARALLRDAPLLILDEPTAALDAATQALRMQGLRRLMAGRPPLRLAPPPAHA